MVAFTRKNADWQVLDEYTWDGESLDFDRRYVYGNYIDEVLMMHHGQEDEDYYYAHDHLYSPAALLDYNGDVVERYEYDAYGYCNVMNASYVSRTTSLYGNTVAFTGRTLDILDNGDLSLMYYRSRYYSPQMGRFLTQDPLGITPNLEKPNRFSVTKQYSDGMNLYEYVQSNPIMSSDPYGLFPIPGGGVDGRPWGMPGDVKCEKKKKCTLHLYSRPDALTPSFVTEIAKQGGLKTAFSIQMYIGNEATRLDYGRKNDNCSSYNVVKIYDHGNSSLLQDGTRRGNQGFGWSTTRRYINRLDIELMCPYLSENTTMWFMGCNVGKGDRVNFQFVFDGCTKISSLKACAGLVWWSPTKGLSSCGSTWGAWNTY